jgi:hypothetical protein
VDEFYIFVSKKNSAKESAVKIPVNNKIATSHTIDVEG